MEVSELLGPDFGAHENNIRDAKTDRDQAEEGCDMGPDQVEALAKCQRSWQDAFGLAL